MKAPQKKFVKVDPELVLAMAPPAMRTSRFYLTPHDGGIRIAFGEVGPDGGVRYSGAIHCSFENALALADLIKAQITVVKPGDVTPPSQGGPAGGFH